MKRMQNCGLKLKQALDLSQKCDASWNRNVYNIYLRIDSMNLHYNKMY